ncbi:Na+/H+ antiporter NhaA [Vibrio chagasii]|nr:Na+/H+ antiporter NhaA [Vibrio chagasii]
MTQGVVAIIALFYPGDLSTLALTVGFIATGVLFMLNNNKHVTKLSAYLIVGATSVVRSIEIWCLCNTLAGV